MGCRTACWCDPMFSSSGTIRPCDRQTDGQTHDDSIYRTSIASRGKNGLLFLEVDPQTTIFIYYYIRQQHTSLIRCVHELQGVQLCENDKNKIRWLHWQYRYVDRQISK